jgi:hypothetical protein
MHETIRSDFSAAGPQNRGRSITDGAVEVGQAL